MALPERVLLGSVAESIVRRASVPVLTIREDGGASRPVAAIRGAPRDALPGAPAPGGALLSSAQTAV